MNNEQLKDGIRATIKENGVNAITGDLLQQVLIAMVNALGTGYQFVGIATPDVDPGTTDKRLCYLAVGTGTYTHFGGIKIKPGESAFLTFDTEWRKVTIVDSPVIWVDVWAIKFASTADKIDMFKALRRALMQHDKLIVLYDGESLFYPYFMFCPEDTQDYIGIEYINDTEKCKFSMEALFDYDTLEIIDVNVQKVERPGYVEGVPYDQYGVFVYRKEGTYGGSWVTNRIEMIDLYHAQPTDMQKVYKAYRNVGHSERPLFGFFLTQLGSQQAVYPVGVNTSGMTSDIKLQFIAYNPSNIDVISVIELTIRPDGVFSTQERLGRLAPL